MSTENTYYTTDENGKFINVYPLEDCFKAIRRRDEDKTKRIERLEAEIVELKDERFADNKLQEMQAQIERLKAENSRGFPITEEESEKIEKWCKEHDKKKHHLDTIEKRAKAGGAIGGRFSYHFVPTSIGTIGSVKCTCGAEFTFSELS